MTTTPALTGNTELVEAISAQVHQDWMATKHAQGVTSRPSETGEEQMVPYADLSEAAKDLDRGTVRSVLGALDALGYRVSLDRSGGDAA
jgi:hypothetical protein